MLVLLLLLSLMILRSRNKRKHAGASIEGHAALSAGAAGGAPAIGSGADLEQQMEARLAEQAAMKARMDAEALNSLKLPQITTKKAEVLTKHISAESKKDPASMAHLVRTWLSEQER